MQQLRSPQQFTEEWVTIYEFRESALEYYVCVTIPIPPKNAPTIITTNNWADDALYTRAKLLNRNSREFLSLTFKRRYEAFFISNDYMKKDDEIIARRETLDEGGTRGERYLVKSKYMLDYLRFTKQELVFAFRSHRFSERFLSELGFKESKKEFNSKKNNYFFQCRSVSQRELAQRPRAKSFSIVFGKCICLAP